MTIEALLALGLLACSFGLHALNRRVTRLDKLFTARLRAGGHFGPPPEKDRP